MFGFSKKKDDAVVNAVCTKLRPLFGILEHRLGGFPPEMTRDPYVLGYVIGSATIFAQIETAGKATTELRGRVSLAALQTVFASLNFSIQQASAAMQTVAGNPEAKRGSNAADLIIGVACGKSDRNNEPEIIAARNAVSAMPHSIKSALGGDENRLLMSELQEQLFFVPLESKYSKNAA